LIQKISREILQQDRQIQIIRKAVTKKILDTLKKLMSDDRDKYLQFWKNFGLVIKEGLFKEPQNKDKIFDCSLFSSSASPSDMFTLSEYVERMKEGQDTIYFITGESREILENSPHLEAFKEKGIEVLYLTDPVDEIWVQYSTEYKGKKLKSAAKGALDLGTEEERKKEEEDLKAKEDKLKSLLEQLKGKLGDNVKEVKLSRRLSNSAACLVGEEGDMSPHLEALLKASGKEVPSIKRTLELNPEHPLIGKLQTIFDKDKNDSRIESYAELLYGQALIAEGGQLADPSSFNKKLTELMVSSL
jgi:molecular chaperone HtpG